MGNDGLPSAQGVLNFIAHKYFQTVDTSNPEELNGYLQYLRDVRKVLFMDAQTGSLIITVECGSLEILDKLWVDYCTGHLNEMAQNYLVTEEILNEFGLFEVKLSTNIQEDEYRAAREYFLETPGKYIALLKRAVHWECRGQCHIVAEAVGLHIFISNALGIKVNT